jgi:UDP-2-acetamido-3-amino-2,3-dideoxy-glucuronate N-acetyltransferase
MEVFIHESAIVDMGAQIGTGSKIWHWVHISAGAVIGNDCSFGQNVFVANKVKIGNKVKVQNNVSIYDNIIIEDEVFCGPSMVFTNVLNPRSAISRKDEYRQTLVRKGCTIGANATVVCGTTLGEYSFIGAGAVVTKNVKPFALITGVPGRQTGWMSKFGEKIPLPLQGSGDYKCPHLGTKYVLKGTDLLAHD